MEDDQNKPLGQSAPVTETPKVVPPQTPTTPVNQTKATEQAQPKPEPQPAPSQPQSPPQNVPTTQVKKSKNIILAIILIVLLLALGGLYILAHNVKKPMPLEEVPSNEQETSAPAPNDTTAEWNTFTGNLFSFKYPTDWTVKEEYSEYFKGDVLTIDNKDKIVSIEITPEQQTYGFGGPESLFKEGEAVTFVFLQQSYQATEKIVDDRTIFVDQKVNVGDSDYWVMFGTGYPVNTDITASLTEYNNEKDIIIKILSTFELVASDSEFSLIEKAIHQATYDSLNETYKNEDTEITVKIDKVEGQFAMGSVSIVFEGGTPGNVWIAKKIDGVWDQIWAGQEVPLCSDLEEYSVPTSITTCQE